MEDIAVAIRERMVDNWTVDIKTAYILSDGIDSVGSMSRPSETQLFVSLCHHFVHLHLNRT